MKNAVIRVGNLDVGLINLSVSANISCTKSSMDVCGDFNSYILENINRFHAVAKSLNLYCCFMSPSSNSLFDSSFLFKLPDDNVSGTFRAKLGITGTAKLGITGTAKLGITGTTVE